MSANPDGGRASDPERATVIMSTDATGFGGAERAMLLLAARLDPAAWRVLVVAREHTTVDRFRDAARELDVDIRMVPPGSPRALRDVLRLAAIFRKERPAIVHVHRPWAPAGSAAILAAVATRTPAVISTEHLWLASTSRRARLLRRVIDRFVDRHVAVSDDIARALTGPLGAAPERVRVIPNGIDVTVPRRTPNRALRDAISPPDHALVLAVAQLRPHKGHAVLLQALRMLPGVALGVVGEGPERERLERLARGLEIVNRVQFLGFRNDVGDLLAVADVVVLPSESEGVPLAVLEALLAHRPVVATDVGGLPTVLVDGVTGLVVPPRNPDALAAAIRRILDDRAFGARLGAAGGRLVRDRFSAERMVARIELLYRETLDVTRYGERRVLDPDATRRS